MGYLQQVFLRTEEANRQVILATASPTPGGTLVDLGCGDGAFTERVAQRVGAGRTIGVELTDSGAEAARRRGIEVRQTDLGTALPFADGEIDVVHSNQVIEHLAGTDLFMQEIRRVLSRNGYAIVSTNNLASLHNIACLVLGYQPPPCHVSDFQVGIGNPLNVHRGLEISEKSWTHLRVFTARALAELATLHGLRVDAAKAAGFYPLPPRAASVATRVAPRWGAFLVQRYSRA